MNTRVWIVMAAAVAAACSNGKGSATVDSARDGNSPVAGANGNAGTRSPGQDRRGAVVFLGTSLTAGMGLEPEEAFPALLQQKIDSAGLPFEVVNAGVSGETSAGALRRIDWLLRQPIDVLVLETGANDGLRALNVDSTKANIQSIISRVRAAKPAARILLVQMEAPPNLGARYTSGFRSMFPDLARENGIVLLPFLLEGVAGERSLNQGDGIHPSAEGSRRIAGHLWPALERELRDAAPPPSQP
jgi:acyl-CoA thioesterase-1